MSGRAFQDWVRTTGKKYGPIFTVWKGTTPLIMINSRELAREAFLKNGVVFGDRPPITGYKELFSSGGFRINVARYGPLMRTLRANLSSGVLSQSFLAKLRPLRDWAMERAVEEIAAEMRAQNGTVVPRVHIRRTIFRIVFAICFGFPPDDETLQRVLDTCTAVHASDLLVDTSIISPLIPGRRKRVRELIRMRRETYIPLIRRALTEKSFSYAKSLKEAKIVEGKDLSDDEMLSLCEELVHAGSDTTYPAIEWAVLRVMHNPEIQRTLQREIAQICASDRAPTEEDLPHMVYLQAVVLETLRRHPPGHFAPNHAMYSPVKFAGFDIPPGSLVNYDIFVFGTDPAVWENPLEFRPERFLRHGDNGELTLCNSDVTGSSKEMKFIPFGVGRRACPGTSLVMLHMPLILGRFFHRFWWETFPGENLDMSDKLVVSYFNHKKDPFRSVVTDRISP
eukprot:TRINITY_DN3134_c0_g1_i1.p1 TRINITY_DN3134_c0_g1~~TRINITY_DN3134_c0_g1_i1.p1  ORF type:complete len:505 (+),score=-10.19 TRINITY_DN3134_c0_g1_i1:160-1515(+)